MSDLHQKHWPRTLPRRLTVPETDLFYNVEVSARRYPNKPFLVFYDTPVTFAAFKDQAERLAGYLQRDCGVRRGDRVLVDLQNSPQFVIAYFAILRAGAVVVPINPMNLTTELRHYVADSGARIAIVGQELASRFEPLVGAAENLIARSESESATGLERVIVAAYSDYVGASTGFSLPDSVAAPRARPERAGFVAWSDALAAQREPAPIVVGPDELCVLPYTSGTTGHPKGCRHSHRNVMYQTLATGQWNTCQSDNVHLAVLPFFHVTGMMSSMNIPLYAGNTVIVLPRWDRDVAARCIERYRITAWTAISTMIVDFLANPNLDDYDLSSLVRLSGGGAAMPAAVAQQLLDRGLTYIEGYGLTETIAASHINPPDRPKKQCLGIPIIDVDSRVVDPQTLTELAPGEIGEIVTHGPQVFQGYWNRPEADRDCFVELDDRRFFRTGDLARVDEDGYFFMVDRLKRMINASGFKVWPAEVELMMYQHPAIFEACVIGAADPHRGETVKAVVVLKAAAPGRADEASPGGVDEAAHGLIDEAAIIDWCRGRMAAYKVPRIVQFVDALPKSGTGKIMWRTLQEQEREQERGGAG